MQDPAQNQVNVIPGVASEDDQRRKLMLEIKQVLNDDKELPDEHKKGLLEKLNLATMVELEKTRQELLKDGQAALKDQKKQEENKR